MASTTDLRPDVRDLAEALIRGLGGVGLQPRLTSTVRTAGQQGRLYRRYMAGLSPYPAAPPGHSTHGLIDPRGGLAFDLVTEPLDALADAGQVWEAWGGVWGGRIGDPVHFESADAQDILRQFEADPPGWLDRFGQWQQEHPYLSAFLPSSLGLEPNTDWRSVLGLSQ